MAAKVIFADFKSKSWHRPGSLEEMAIALTEQFNKMAEEGTVVECIPYGGKGIDGMMFSAPETDPA